MNILITGADGFIGKNLTEALKSIRDGKDKTCNITVDKLFCFDVNTEPTLLEEYTRKCDFVFHLAGVNRPDKQEAFMQGNRDFLNTVLSLLKQHQNTCPVMLSSSIQAERDNPYGESKRAAEKLLLDYGKETGARVLVYRFPNVFGKWCRPNYNSAVATFCHHIANDLPIQVNDRNTGLRLVYIDDVVKELVNALSGGEHRDGELCSVPVVHSATLGEITDLLYRFHAYSNTLMMPSIPDGSFEKKLYSTYLSYLPKDKLTIALKTNTDARGSFTELMHTPSSGQFSVNVTKPGITKGQHWHHTKWEFFIVVSGTALIQQRKIGTDKVINIKVSDKKMEAVYMLPGYTHSIINLSDTDDLVTLMWANENFDSQHPDTFFEPVE